LKKKKINNHYSNARKFEKDQCLVSDLSHWPYRHLAILNYFSRVSQIVWLLTTIGHSSFIIPGKKNILLRCRFERKEKGDQPSKNYCSCTAIIFLHNRTEKMLLYLSVQSSIKNLICPYRYLFIQLTAQKKYRRRTIEIPADFRSYNYLLKKIKLKEYCTRSAQKITGRTIRTNPRCYTYYRLIPTIIAPSYRSRLLRIRTVRFNYKV
jgi:hypothetical protein